jgi:hypothetical protein
MRFTDIPGFSGASAIASATPGTSQHLGGDVAQLDAETVQLHLLIPPPIEEQRRPSWNQP